MKRVIVVLLLVICCIFTKGENTEWKINGQVLIFSQHIWRGMGIGDAQCIEPSVTFSKGIFAINLWAAKTIDDSYTEIDIIPSITLGNYQFIIYQYYNPITDAENSFFNFEDQLNRHSLELAFSKKPTKAIPIRFLISSFFFGDENPQTGNPFYSSYTEVGAPFKLLDLDIEPMIGITTHKGYYASEFAVINTSLNIQKNIKLSSSLNVPLKLLMIYNPNKKEKLLSVGTGVFF